MTDLFWSAAWADYIGADGALVTQVLQRATLLDDNTAEQLRRSELDTYGSVRGPVDAAMNRLWPVAEAHGLRGALACARQSAARAVRVHLAGDEIASDRWSIWRATDHALGFTVAALVMRAVADPADTTELTRVWTAVLGPLPERYAPNEDRGPVTCRECGGTAGAPGVSAAEADRYARHLQRGNQVFLDAAQGDVDRLRFQLGEFARTHMGHDEIRRLIAVELDAVKGISPRVRAELERRFGITGQWRVSNEGGAGGTSPPAKQSLPAGDGIVESLFDLEGAS